MGIREYIEKGRKLKEIIETIQSMSEEEKIDYLERDKFNELLSKHGLNPIPVGNEAPVDKAQEVSASYSNAISSGGSKSLQDMLQGTVNEYELPVIANPFEDLTSSIFDIEVYRNFFAAVFLDEQGFHVFTLSEREALVKYITDGRKIFVGYNIFHYDNPVLKYIRENENLCEEDIFNFSQRIIQGDNQYFRTLLEEPAIDLFAMKFKTQQLKLKEVAVRLGCMNIQCLPYPPDTMLTDEQKVEVVKYCINDILITTRIWEHVQEDIKLRKRIGSDYGIDAISDSEPRICEKLFRSLYSRKAQHPVENRIERGDEIMNVTGLIPSWISFKSPALNALLQDFKMIRAPLSKLEEQTKKQISFQGKNYQLGSGGIHSQDEPGIYQPSSERRIIDLDIQSCYPSILIKEGLHPDHLAKEWTDILQELTEKRIEAKRIGDKATSETLKIVINGANGKTKQNYSFMYDPKVYYSVVFTGQFTLLMLIEKLTSLGIQVLSANTDGLVVIFEKAKEPTFEEACREWTSLTGFVLEKAEIKKYVRKDVNNYLMIREDGMSKRKGIFEAPSIYRKSDAPIISEALCEHFISNTAVEDTIKNETSILKFAYSFSPKKEGYRLYAGSEELAPLVRWYACNKGVALEKRKEGKTIKIPNAGRASVINRLASIEVPDDIDFEHYIQEIKKIIGQIAMAKETISDMD